MSQYSVFKERLDMRLKKYPGLGTALNGQCVTVVNLEHPEGAKLRVTPGPRPCTVLVATGTGEPFRPVEWVTLEAALLALSGSGK